MSWKPDEAQIAEYTAILRASLPGWGVVWDPSAEEWIAVRGKDAAPVTAPTPAKLLAAVTGSATFNGGDGVSTEAAALAGALTGQDLNALAHGHSVTVWRKGGEESALMIVPALSHDEAVPLWSWQQGRRGGHHERADPGGTAAQVAAFLADAPP